MANRIRSFADIIAPVSEAEFFSDFHDRHFLHVPASDPEKFSDVMSWDILTSMLNMTAIWSPTSLQLVLDTKPVPTEKYCRQAVDRNGQMAPQPDAEKVKAWLRRGASLVANDIDTLWPGTAAAADALERRLGGRAQSNLYCSWKQHQAFETHFDTHEVFALHVAGEKVWRIYEGRLDHPIASGAFKSLGPEYHNAHRGAVAAEITLRPGDLLYIPRGQYHDALASSEGCIHLAFGVTHIVGIDVMSMIYERAMADPLFRRNIPLPEAGPAARRRWLGGLAKRLSELADNDEMMQALETFREGFRYYRGGFDLPTDALEKNPGDRFAVAVRSLKVVDAAGKFSLHSEKADVPIPADLAGPISWIIERGEFSPSELAAAHPELADELRDKLISQLTAMKAIVPV